MEQECKVSGDRMPRPRVLIADDFPNILDCVANILSKDCDVVASVSDGLAAVDGAIMLQPDVIVLDISMPVLSGLEAAARLTAAGSPARIVLLTVHEDPDFLEAARSAGAHGYVIKRTMTTDLLPAIRTVLNGGLSFTPPAAFEIDTVNP
jgi:DNA-binding NarL/FixJ family response regulator